LFSHFYAFMIAKRNIPNAINAPMTAPMTDIMPTVTVPTRFIIAGGVPINERTPAPHKNNTPTISPMTMRIPPTALLFPDPKYAVKIPAIILAIAKTSIIMLRKYCNTFFSPLKILFLLMFLYLLPRLLNGCG